MKTQEVVIKPSVKVVMMPDTEILDEVTVVAYGTKRKQDLVGSISSVKNEIISNSQATSVSNALEGAVAGLQVVSSSGQPGKDANIVLRGIGSISASNNALIVVDGVPFNGKLSDINPTDIASVNVSKDAVSNSLYGSRAAGGVVMITTKTGRKDKVAINFNGTWGVTQRAYKDYDMATDPGEFYRLSWYGLRNTYWAAGNSIEDSNLAASQDLLGELGNYNAYIIPQGEYLVTPDGKLNPNARLRYNDSFADALFDNAFRQEYNVSASGGNDRTDYYVSMGFLDNDSYVLGSSYERFTARANVNSQLKSWLKVGTNVGYSKATQNGVQENAGAASNPFDVARSWAPIFPVHAYDAEGNMKYYEDGSPMYDAGNGETDGTSKRPTATNQNVIANMKEDIRETVYNNLTSRSYLEISFLKNFKFTANYSYDFTNSSQTVFYTPLIGDGQSFGGRGTKGSYNTTTTNFNQILAYSNVFGDNHHLSAKIGHEYYKYEYQYLAGQKTNFFNPNNPELDNGGQMQYINSYTANHNIEGYFGMADYDYSNKYYLSAAFRRDGTSRFLDRWGNFWSVGAAWRISNEAFMEGTGSWLNDLKLRASYGTQGNESILSDYNYAYVYTPYQDQYTVTWNGSELGYSPEFYGNPDLTWEKQKTFDVGVDFRLFDRVYGSFEYFYRRTDDMLFKRPVAYSTAGRPYNWENLGAMKNTGIEFEVNVDIFNQPDLKWTVSLVGSHYKNRIVTLPEENRENGITSGPFNLREGKSRFEYYTYMYAGIGVWRAAFKPLVDRIADTDIRLQWFCCDRSTGVTDASGKRVTLIRDTKYPVSVEYQTVKFIGTGRDNIKAGVFSGWELGDYIYLRSEEAYMIKMEALAHKGSADAITELNSFMKTRQPDYNYTFTNKADLIEEIIYQKRVEFWGEGLEYIDNRRLNIPVDRTDETWGAENNNHFSAGKFRYNQEERPFLYQLPLSEIENNSQLSPTDQN